MTILRTLTLALVASAGLFAQASLQQTTLTAAVTGANSGPSFVQVAASPTTCTPSISQNCILYVDNEAMLITAISSTNNKLLTVTRGYFGTGAGSHASGDFAWIGTTAQFGTSDHAGACIVTQPLAVPEINVNTGRQWYCNPANLEWVMAVEPTQSAPYFNRTVVNDAAYTLTVGDYIVAYTVLSATRAVTLPAASPTLAGKVWIVKDESGAAGANAITITGTLDGATNKSIAANYGALRIYCTGTAFFTW